MSSHNRVYRIHSVACGGNEAHLSACTMEFSKNTSIPCPAGGPAAVSCVPGPQFSQGHKNKHKKKRTVSSNLLPLKAIVASVGAHFTSSFMQGAETVWHGFLLKGHCSVI